MDKAERRRRDQDATARAKTAQLAEANANYYELRDLRYEIEAIAEDRTLSTTQEQIRMLARYILLKE